MEELKAALKEFYDCGWDAAHRGEPFAHTSTRDWQDGWRDRRAAKPEHQRPFPPLPKEPA